MQRRLTPVIDHERRRTLPEEIVQPAHREHVILGMTAALGAFLMFTVMNVFAKLLSASHSVIEISFYRNLVACLPSGKR